MEIKKDKILIFKKRFYDILCILLLLLMIVIFFWNAIIGTEGLCRKDADITVIFQNNYYNIASYWRDNKFTLWDPYKFTGYNIVGSPNAGLFYPLNWPLFLLIPEETATGFYYLNLYIIFHFSLLALIMYFFILHLIGNRIGAVFSAIIFTYNAWMMSHLNHFPFIIAIVWVLLSLFLLYLWDIKKRIHYLIFAAFFFSWSFLVGHGQIFLFSVYLFSFFIFYVCFFSNNLQQLSLIRRVRYFAKSYILFGILTFGFVAISLLPILEFMKFSPRAAYTARNSLVGSLPFKYIQTIFKPESFGFHHYEYDVLYFGLLPMVFLVLSLFWKNRLKYFFIFALIFFTLLSFGENTIVGRILYPYLPGLGVTRAPARWIFIPMICISVLAGAGLNVLKQSLNNRRWNKTTISAILLILSVLVYSDLFRVYSKFNKGGQAYNLTDTEIFRFLDKNLPDKESVVFRANVGASKKMIGLFNPGESPSDQNIMSQHQLLCRVCKIDGASGFNVYQLTDKFSPVSGVFELDPYPDQSPMIDLLGLKYFLSKLPLDRISETLCVLKDVTASSYYDKGYPYYPEYAVDGICYVFESNCWAIGDSKQQNEWISIRFKKPVEIEGFDFLRDNYKGWRDKKVIRKMAVSFSDGKREEFSFTENKEINTIKFRDVHKTTFVKLDILDMLDLDIKGEVVNVGINEIIFYFTERERYLLAKEPRYKRLYDLGEVGYPGYYLYQNRKVIPRAYFVTQAVVEADAEKIFSQIADEQIDFRNTVVLDRLPQKPILSNSSDPEQFFNPVSFEKYKNDIVELSFENTSPCYLVLTDTFYPGWIAYVDGKRTEILKAYSFFRAVPIYKEGKHTVIFRYRPLSFFVGLSITLFTYFVVIVYFLIYRIKLRKMKVLEGMDR